jgi:hypothetical protein
LQRDLEIELDRLDLTDVDAQACKNFDDVFETLDLFIYKEDICKILDEVSNVKALFDRGQISLQEYNSFLKVKKLFLASYESSYPALSRISEESLTQVQASALRELRKKDSQLPSAEEVALDREGLNGSSSSSGELVPTADDEVDLSSYRALSDS